MSLEITNNVGSNCPYDIILHKIRPFLLPRPNQCCIEFPLHSILFLDRELHYSMVRYLPSAQCRKGKILDFTQNSNNHTTSQSLQSYKSSTQYHTTSDIIPKTVKFLKNDEPSDLRFQFCSIHHPLEYCIMEYFQEHQYQHVYQSSYMRYKSDVIWSISYHPSEDKGIFTAWEKETGLKLDNNSNSLNLQPLLERIRTIVTTYTYYEFTHFCCSNRGINFRGTFVTTAAK